MSKINIKTITPLPNALFEVEVVSETTTIHNVHLSQGYYQKLTGGQITADELIKRSFEFLLDREPNTMILKEFELQDISRYFPDFEESISKITAKTR